MTVQEYKLPNKIFGHRGDRSMVSPAVSKKIFRYVLAGHGIVLTLPIVLGIVFGWFEKAPDFGDIYIEMGDLPAEPEGGTEQEPPVEEQVPEEQPELPELPEVTPPELPDPPEQESDSTLPPLPKPPRIPKPPKLPTVAPPKPAKPDKPKSQPAKPASTVHNDNWTPANQGSGGGSKSGTGSSRPGGGSSGFAGQLKGFIDNMWIDAPTDAPQEFSSRVVQLALDIAADGRIISAKIHKKSGYPALDASAAKLCTRLQNAKGPAPGSRYSNFIVNLSITPE